ncbi:MAG: DUF4367 domain-containing protein [Oscillospiraceae bacterium]|nr:DUF4367 domain-containing protein [Oscillospiraceae bacterium]
MNSYEAIRDRYEDALLERMMEAVRTAQGQAALAENERLRADPGAAVPRSLDQKCRRLIRRGYRKGQLHRSGRITLRVAGRVAVIVAVLMVTFAVAYAASPAIRTATNTWIVNTFKDHTEIVAPIPPDYDPSQPDERKTVFDSITLQANWLPDDFSLYKSTDSYIEKNLEYRGPDGGRLFAAATFTIGTSDNIDTEDSDISYFTIFGTPATLISKRGREAHQIVWFIEKAGTTVYVFGENVSERDTKVFALNLEIKYNTGSGLYSLKDVDLTSYPEHLSDWSAQQLRDYFADSGIFIQQGCSLLQDRESFGMKAPINEVTGYIITEDPTVYCLIYTVMKDDSEGSVSDYLDYVREKHKLPIGDPVDHLADRVIFCYGGSTDQDFIDAMEAAYNRLITELGVTPDF